MNQVDIFSAIEQKRTYQDTKWGSSFGDLNTPNDWVAYIAKYLGLAVTLPWSSPVFRQSIMKVATLCVAILERDEYAQRHYDKKESV